MVQAHPSAPVLMTMGEPGGIGPELTCKIWLQRNQNNTPPFILLTDPDFIKSRAQKLGLDVSFNIMDKSDDLSTALSRFSKTLPILPLTSRVHNNPGIADPINANAVIEAIEKGVGLIKQSRAAALVTNPINKKSLNEAGFGYPGHTEFLGALSAQWPNGPFTPVMMLAGPELKTVPATVHIPLKEVPETLNSDALLCLIKITAKELHQRFNITAPRLVVSGLNPHAGEGGMMGDEDDRIISPAIKQARNSGINVTGPHPADTLFHKARRVTYDAAIAMYHDQALLPVKTLAFDETVNVTLGLPFIRTSPDHGTALDIASKGIARPDSLLSALKMAQTMANHCHTNGN